MDSRTCFKPMRTEFSLRMLRLYQHYKLGYLPFSGGVLQQPNKFLEAMEAISGTIAGIERERFEQMQKEARKS